MINQVASLLIIHSFIQQCLLYRLLFRFFIAVWEGVPRLRCLIPQSFYYFSQVMCQEFRQCVRNELSLFHVTSPEAGTSELTSSLTCLTAQQGCLEQPDSGWRPVACFSWLTGFFILLHAVSEPLSPWSFLHMASPLSLSMWSFKLGNINFLHALLRRQTWNHQAIFCVGLNQTSLRRRH